MVLLLLFRYNVVFRYLLSVRRVQSELQHCWALQMQRKHLKSNKTDAVKWRLRNHMAFLVDNLQYYLQVPSDPSTLISIYFAAGFQHCPSFLQFISPSGGCLGIAVFSAFAADQLDPRL